jgi:hypothetical protein
MNFELKALNRVERDSKLIQYRMDFCFGKTRSRLIRRHCAVNSRYVTPWSESASELYRPNDRRLSAK